MFKPYPEIHHLVVYTNMCYQNKRDEFRRVPSQPQPMTKGLGGPSMRPKVTTLRPLPIHFIAFFAAQRSNQGFVHDLAG